MAFLWPLYYQDRKNNPILLDLMSASLAALFVNIKSNDFDLYFRFEKAPGGLAKEII